MAKHDLSSRQLGVGMTDEGCPCVETSDCCVSPEDSNAVKKDSESVSDSSQYADSSEKSPPGAQILGVAILEFGILFHSVRSELWQVLKTAHYRHDPYPFTS